MSPKNTTKKQRKPPEVKGRGQHPNSQKTMALHAWKKGQSGNPGGKPLGALNFKTRFENKLQAITPDVVQKAAGIVEFCKGIKAGEISNADALDAVLLYKGIVERDLGAIKEILDRTEGKATQPLEHSGPGGAPLETQVIFKRAKTSGSE